MNKICYCIGLITLSGAFYSSQTFAQSILKKSSNQICICLDEKAKSDTLNLTPKQIFDRCTGETMGRNRVELAEKFDMGTVEGIWELRDKLAELLNQECDKFNEMFIENSNKKE